MCRLLGFSMAICLFAGGVANSDDKTPSEKALAKAIALLEMERDAIDDGIEQARIDKAIRELETMIGDPEHRPPKPVVLDFEVSQSALKKKFSGKAVYNTKTGELTIAYDFAGKGQLSDFEVNDAKVAVAKKFLAIDAGDKLTHVARFKSFTASTIMSFKSMRGCGVFSSNGSGLVIGGPRQDSIRLVSADGRSMAKVVNPKLRSGSIPVSLTVTASKTSASFADERIGAQTVRPDDVHCVVLDSGTEGCAFSSLTITGIPDPAWLKEFLAAE